MKKKFFIGLFVVAAIGLFVFAHIVLKSSEYTKPQQNLQAPIEIPAEYVVEYNEITDFDKPSIVLFYVDWCGYCRRFMPEYGKLAKKLADKYNFAIINCENPKNIDMVTKYHISGFPTVFMIDKKLDHSFSLYLSSQGTDVIEEELDNYINFRNRMLKNLK